MQLHTLTYQNAYSDRDALTLITIIILVEWLWLQVEWLQSESKMIVGDGETCK